YLYQLPPGRPNHTCGGANIWADVSRGGSMFCSAGSYCPTNTQEIPCASGMSKQRLREARIQSIDYLILLLAGACLGLISKGGDENFGAPGYTYTIIATSLLCKIAALRTFALDKLQYRRERASGISSLAHFVAKDTIDHFNTLIKPLVYLSMFYFFSNPRSLFLDNYIVLLCLVYCVTGVAYALAIFLEPGPSQLCSVLLPVVLTLLSTRPKDSTFMKILTSLCYPRWALEAFIVSNAKRYYGVWLIQRCGALLRTGYNLHQWNLCISLLLAAGAACRILAFIVSYLPVCTGLNWQLMADIPKSSAKALVQF
ncbi:ABC transporter G family member 24, partial [Sesamum angolense]